MKKVFYTLISVLALAGACFAILGGGFGGILTASTACQQFTITGNANVVSVYNNGTNTVFCLVQNTTDNTVFTTNTLSTRITAGTAVPVPASVAFSFDSREKGSISKLFYATTNATSEVFVSCY